MTGNIVHPEDFSAYLDGQSSDPGYQAIVQHLNDCAGCRGEVQKWQSCDSVFRSREIEIDVPPFQWQRISARMEQPAARGVFDGFWSVLRPWKPGWNATLATLLAGAILVGGFEYHRSSEEKQLLLAITRYTAVAGARIRAEENPFLGMAANGGNPFTRSSFAGESRPAAGQR